MQTLMLLPWMMPHKVISWQRAIVLSFLGKVEVVAEYDEVVYHRRDSAGADDRRDGSAASSTPSLSLRAPAVVRMRRAVNPRGMIRFCRANVFRRDAYACQYCGAVLRGRDLTFDHVIPRARGGRTDWDNIVTCCRPCNDEKRARTPDEAGMKLRARPARPSWLPPVPLAVRIELSAAPKQWRAWV